MKVLSEKSVVEAAVEEYAALRRNIELLEKRVKEVKVILEEYLATEPDNKAEIAGWLCTLSSCEREIFNLSRAKEKLDGRMLKPFITKTEYSQLRVTYKGGAQ